MFLHQTGFTDGVWSGFEVTNRLNPQIHGGIIFFKRTEQSCLCELFKETFRDCWIWSEGAFPQPGTATVPCWHWLLAQSAAVSKYALTEQPLCMPLNPENWFFFFLYINMWQYLEKNSCWPLMQMTLTNSSQAQPRPLIRRVRFPLWLDRNSLIHSPSQHEAYKLVNSLNLIYLTWSISLCPRILPASKQPYVTALQLFIVPVILMPLSVRTDISFNKGPY